MSFFRLKDRLDAVEYSLFNILSDLLFKFSFSVRSITSKNEGYKNRYSGERCFIIGTGPSLNSLTRDEVEFLKGEVVFGVNSFYKAECLDGVVPAFYALLDNNYLSISRDAFSDVLEKYIDSPPIFITDYRAYSILKSISIENSSIFVHAKNYPVSDIRYDLAGNLSISMNVVSFCIQAAMYMGFKEIYLLGCDYSAFCSGGGGHCYDDKEELSELPSYNLGFYLKYYYLTTNFHYKIRAKSKSEGIEVKNLTPGSLLDAYPFGNLSELI